METPHPESLAGRLQTPNLLAQRSILLHELNDLPIHSGEFSQKTDELRELNERIESAKLADQEMLQNEFGLMDRDGSLNP